MRYVCLWASGCLLVAIVSASGCRSDATHTEKGALLGSGLGAGAGALLGAASGHAGAGAVIGGAAGALTGAAVGSSVDEAEARNRQVNTAVTVSNVVAMKKANVSDEQMVKDIHLHGVLAKPTSDDLILLKQNNVSDRVIDAMRAAPVVVPRAVVYEPYPPPVVVHYEVGPPPPPRCYHHRPW